MEQIYTMISENFTEAILGRFYAENGFHTVAKARFERCAHWVRNYFFARTFGVRSMNIGSGSHLRGLKHVQLGENFSAGRGLWLDAVTEYYGEEFKPEIIIGDDVGISFWSHIAAVNYIRIGSGVLIGSKVIITDHNHGYYGPEEHSSPMIPPTKRPLSRGRVVIGNNVWIGDGVVVGPSAEIGDGCVIGANAVVRGAIPAYTIAAGIPAKPIKRYDFDKGEWLRIQS